MHAQLAPSDSTLKEFHEGVVKDSEARARKAQVVSLVVSSVVTVGLLVKVHQLEIQQHFNSTLIR